MPSGQVPRSSWHSPMWVSIPLSDPFTPYSWHLRPVPLGHFLSHQLCTCLLLQEEFGCQCRQPGPASLVISTYTDSPHLSRAQRPRRTGWTLSHSSDKVVPQPVGLEVDENDRVARVPVKGISEQLGPHDSLRSITNPRLSHLLNQFFQ